MNLLLDSHALISWHEEPKQLSSRAFQAISDPANKIFLSIASIWEIQIKIQIGKFKFVEPLVDVIQTEQTQNSFRLLPIEFSHVLALANLPFHHKDPFDRLLISQSVVENMTLVSADKRLSAYDVNLLW